MEIDNITLNMKQKLMIFSVIAFFITLIGTGYAFVTGDLAPSRADLFIGSVGLNMVYEGTSQAIIADLAPGESVTKTFEVTNLSGLTQIYNLYWKEVTNTLVDKNYFMYVIKDADTGEALFYPKYLPTRSTHVLYDISIEPNETHSYELVLYYVDDPKYNQLQNADLTFIGDISFDQGNQVQRTIDMISIYVNGVAQDYLPTLSSYSIDTTRTYCTDGSSISITGGELVIDNLTKTTSCEVYLVSGSPAAITNDPYNLLIVDLGYDDAVLESTPEIKYRYEGELVTLGVPTKSGYAFTGWQVSGSGTQIVDNTKVLMGKTYSYAKATWAEGYYVKTTQVCGQGNPTSYTRTYKTCNANLVDYTKIEKQCLGSSWSKTSSLCGVLTQTYKVFTCAASAWGYPGFPDAPSAIDELQTSCTESDQTCTSQANVDSNNKKVTCTPTRWWKIGKRCSVTAYNYVTTNPSVQTDCSSYVVTAPSTCDSANSGQSYITACNVNCKHAAAHNAVKGTCICKNINGSQGLYDAGCALNVSICSTTCSNLGGSVYSFQASLACDPNPPATCAGVYGCGTNGSSCTLSGDYCYKYNQASCSTSYGWSIASYRPEIKTCTATYDFSDIDMETKYYSTCTFRTPPANCDETTAGDYITSCVEYKWTKKTYNCQSTAWSFGSTPTSTTTYTYPDTCPAESNPSCASANDVGNQKKTCTPATYGWTVNSPVTANNDDGCNNSPTCNALNVGNSFITSCSILAYNFGEHTITEHVAANQCTPNPVSSCNSGTLGLTDVQCDPNYSYSFSSVVTNDNTTITECAPSNFECNEQTSTHEYIVECSPATYGYGFSPSTSNVSSCFVDETHSPCQSESVGTSYIYSCDFVSN